MMSSTKTTPASHVCSVPSSWRVHELHPSTCTSNALIAAWNARSLAVSKASDPGASLVMFDSSRRVGRCNPLIARQDFDAAGVLPDPGRYTFDRTIGGDTLTGDQLEPFGLVLG